MASKTTTQIELITPTVDAGDGPSFIPHFETCKVAEPYIQRTVYFAVSHIRGGDRAE
jgi:hypothetical protein